jgi:hypothetical protein
MGIVMKRYGWRERDEARWVEKWREVDGESDG